MDGWSFVDLATKAKELGISEGTLKARILSGEMTCFIYAANFHAEALPGEWLPAHDTERFPIVEWLDHGSAFRYEGDQWSYRTPCYHIAGWVVPCVSLVEKVLTLGKMQLNGACISVIDVDSGVAGQLRISIDPEKEWVNADSGEYIEGGYWREVPVTMTAAGLFMRAAVDSTNKTLTTRKEQSYLGIVAAMRALLRSKDAGAFPSDAKLIELLVDRYKVVDGISKRNLELVFADAFRSVGDLLHPK